MTPAHRNPFLLALGSNMSHDMTSNTNLLNDAIDKIKRAGVVTLRRSRSFATPAFPAGAGPDFANACLLVESDLTPEALLALLHQIEAEMGRVRIKRWGQRVIDIDLLAAGGQVLPDRDTVEHWMALPPEHQARVAPEQLIVPHPRLHQRGFVLVPLAEVAPDWVHPLTGQSVRTMLEALDPAEIAEIRPI
ncbi:2-amino-4-hydroxy-6-hydroxymethyldihydropteridine diphosphokinase [Pararhodobacter zhoushanensis]|uniref:2-amino-4-hydroxy-6-hydroxymethyldihydropteridine pyrophosphokinase n=1 Tax=Pararhodobacter zhoushanensis TaxID=2479545 RepID=A0ABT3GX83_9RHOB|nr:2-amino-4-hydroxy-6-hydroxymethyldihydropteridine diphosphokinase [Pararhodobacter zhoushanensis]MCW1932132.1 2-amino-4-hydroxy-6-hydroxymethyldihydropteridine diphosphokinase [Pararhodobacter zhoushanensis]